MAATTILLYGRTNSGKSTQLGILAEDVYVRTGKKTRLITTDRGGIDPIRPYVNLNIIEPVEFDGGNIWVFISRAVRGYTKVGGKWVLDANKNKEIGCYAFESAHSMAKLLQMDMEEKAGIGNVMGGDTNASFTMGDGDESVRIGALKGYQKYAIPQAQIHREIVTSQRLDAEYVIWTAGVSKDEDEVNSSKVVGPDVIGKAMTGVLPMDFNYTFRIDVMPAAAGKPERHIIFLGNNADVNAGNAAALGNIRRPLDAPALVSTMIEPANIVTALNTVRNDAVKEATEKIRARIAKKA